jgi:peptidoglycan hydrolase-like protein with peptidoglycan-binding domain
VTRRTLVVGGAVVLGVAAVGAVALNGVAAPTTPDAAAATATPTLDTATIEERTLAVTEDLTGELAYDGEMNLVGNLNGILTRIAAVGDVLAAGEVAYEVDGTERAVVMLGDRPAWRTLERGVSRGQDVRQLEQNLRDLAYGRGLTVDTKWTAATTRAVKRWQKATGLDKDGVVDLGEVVFLGEPLRVTEQGAELGTRVGPGSTVLSGTSDRPVVAIDLDADRQDIVPIGSAVTITMPDGSEVPGSVAEIGRVATATEDAFGNSSTPTVEVTVVFDDPSAAADLDGAPVTVTVTRSTRPSVLAVPVNALVALLEGGYAVEVVADDGTTRLVGVETGLFDDGWVEVSGDGLAAGQAVVVP